MRSVHRLLAALIVAAVAAQFALAGAGAFGAIGFGAHTTLGWAIAFLALASLATAALGRGRLRPSGLLFAAVVVQVALGVLGENASAWFGAVHGLGAMAVAGAAGNLIHSTRAASPAVR